MPEKQNPPPSAEGAPLRLTSRLGDPVHPGGRGDPRLYRMALRGAWVSGLFCAVVAVLLAVNAARTRAADPLTSRRMVELRRHLARNPADAPSRRELRELDLELRRRYFAGVEFGYRGSLLLAGGAIVFLACARYARQFRKRLPNPLETPQQDLPRLSRAATAAVVGTGVVVLAGLGWMAARSRRDIAAEYAKAAGLGDDVVVQAGGYADAAEMARNWPGFRGFRGAGLAPDGDFPTVWNGATGDGVLWKASVPLKGQSSPVVWGDRVYLTGADESRREVYCFDAGTGRLLWSRPVGPVAALRQPREGSASSEGTSAASPTPDGGTGAAAGAGDISGSVTPGEGAASGDITGLASPGDGGSSGDIAASATPGEPSSGDISGSVSPGGPTGDISGTVGAPPAAPSAQAGPTVSSETGYAAPTVATDGRRVFAVFATGHVGCFDLEGKPLWSRSLGAPKSLYGHASSPVTWRNRLILQLDQGSTADEGKSALLALDTATGATVWRTPRPVPNSWSTPIVIDTGQREEIITCANPWVIAYDPATGAELWRAELLEGDVAPTPVYAGGLVFVANTGSCAAAVRPGGSGNVTRSHVLWRATEGLPDLVSPASDGRRVLLVNSIALTCYDARSGKRLWEHLFENDFRCSPTFVGRNAYLTDTEGVTHIVEVADRPRVLRSNPLGEPVSATPAFVNGRIYLRGESTLYCIGGRHG